VLVAVARAGVAVTGVDGSAAMLARVRAALAGEPPEVRQRVTLRQADMCVAEAGRRFALVTLPFRPIGHVLEVDRQLQLFRNARRHLLPSGRLVLDMFHPNPAYLTGPGEERLDLEREEDGCRIRRFSRIRPHLASQVLEVHYRWEVVGRGGEVREERVSFPLRWYHRFELEHLLARSGFGILELYGDFRRGPFRDDTWEMVVVAVPREPASG
jgi:SAM-dependent methyltransferase